MATPPELSQGFEFADDPSNVSVGQPVNLTFSGTLIGDPGKKVDLIFTLSATNHYSFGGNKVWKKTIGPLAHTATDVNISPLPFNQDSEPKQQAVVISIEVQNSGTSENNFYSYRLKV